MHDIQKLHDRRAVILMVTFVPSYMSLSMPRGPSVERTASTTAPQALMF